MNNKTTFYLARHGQTEWNVEYRIQGQLDSPLTLQGEKQASQLAVQCGAVNITQILTSPLGRAVETATICAEVLNLTVKTVPGFEERHFGLWQGKLVAEVKVETNYNEITSQITDCKPEQGESAKQLLTRFEKALKAQLQTASDQTFLIVSHGDILRTFMAQFNLSSSSSSSLQAAASSQPVLRSGYDYKNAQLIPISYDQTTGTFSRL